MEAQLTEPEYLSRLRSRHKCQSVTLRTLPDTALAVIPRGGFYQNMYRMIYEQARLNGLGRRAQIASTASATHEFALRAVGEQQPDFIPVLLS